MSKIPQNGRFPAQDADEPPCKIWRRYSFILIAGELHNRTWGMYGQKAPDQTQTDFILMTIEVYKDRSHSRVSNWERLQCERVARSSNFEESGVADNE